jgi:hypothetical protein
VTFQGDRANDLPLPLVELREGALQIMRLALVLDFVNPECLQNRFDGNFDPMSAPPERVYDFVTRNGR